MIFPLKIETRLAGDSLGTVKNKYIYKKKSQERISIVDPWNYEVVQSRGYAVVFSRRLRTIMTFKED